MGSQDDGGPFSFRPDRFYAESVDAPAKTSPRVRVALGLLVGGALGACVMAWRTSGEPNTVEELLAGIVDCERRGMLPHTMPSGRTVCYPPAQNIQPAPPLWPRTPSQAMRQTP